MKAKTMSVRGNQRITRKTPPHDTVARREFVCVYARERERERAFKVQTKQIREKKGMANASKTNEEKQEEKEEETNCKLYKKFLQ